MFQKANVEPASNFYKYLAAWRGAIGLSVPSPRPFAQGQRFAVGFPLLSLAGVLQECLYSTI